MGDVIRGSKGYGFSYLERLLFLLGVSYFHFLPIRFLLRIDYSSHRLRRYGIRDVKEVIKNTYIKENRRMKVNTQSGGRTSVVDFILA